VHSDARRAEDTDWTSILALYDQLLVRTPTAVVALNRAIAVAEVHGPEVALATIDELDADLAGYHHFHATRADLLRRLARHDEAVAAYDAALALTGNDTERRFLEGRRSALAQR
jgi:RNA polymerase sigma-70 factor (ECF subfamily)